MPQENQGFEAFSGTFDDYHRTLYRLIGDLKRAKPIAQELGLGQAADLIGETIRRVEMNTFNLAIVGEFKRGKSRLINALLGMELLPSDVLPTTAALNRICYGLEKSARIEFRDGHSEEVSLDKLHAYITKLTTESEEVARTVKQAIIRYPSPYCQHNVQIIDTPGLNDEETMTAVTLSVLPETDVAILVISAVAPFSEYERDLVERHLLAADLGRVLFVVNQMDLMPSDRDKERILEAIENRIKTSLIERARRQFGADSEEFRVYSSKIGTPRIYGVSAAQAMEAKLTQDPALLQKSQFPALETALQQVLTEERGLVTLQIAVDRLIGSGHQMLEAITLNINARSLERDQFEAASVKSENEIDAVRTKCRAERSRVRAAAREVEAAAIPMAIALEKALLTAAVTTIDAARINGEELDYPEKLGKRLGDAVAEQVQYTVDTEAGKVTRFVLDRLEREVQQLRDLEEDASSLLSHIRLNFTDEPAGVDAVERAGQGAMVALAIVTGLGGLWSGYRAAGWKGAGAGAAISAGAAIGAGFIFTALSLPITFPVVVAVGLLSILPGGWAAKKMFKEHRIEVYRERYRTEILRNLEEKIREANVRSMVVDQVRAVFDALDRKIEEEVEAKLRDAEKALINLRAEYERDAVTAAEHRRRLTELRENLDPMVRWALKVNEYLARVTAKRAEDANA